MDRFALLENRIWMKLNENRSLSAAILAGALVDWRQDIVTTAPATILHI